MNIGDIWNGWTITDFIGEGSFGKVYKIKREEFGYTYYSALKVLRIPQNKVELATAKHDGMSDESISTYFQGMVEDIVSEFALMSQLRGNSNIVSFEDHQVEKLEDEFGWNIYIRMELLTPLYDYLRDNSMSIRDVIILGIDMCNALEICQKYNIIHRDIKPENIFVSDQGNYKLGDFGIARQLEKTATGLSKKGTLSYMAPEVYKGQAYNSTVDIYSLGLVLYRFLNNNRMPFLPPYPEQIHYSDKERANLLRMSGEEFKPPCNAKGRLAEIVMKASAYEARDRYESAYEMRKALEAIAYTEEESRIIYPMGDSLGRMDRSASATAETVEQNRTVPEEVRLNSSPEKAAEETKEDKAGETKGKRGSLTRKPLFWICAAILAIMLCVVPVLYHYYHHAVPDLTGMKANKAQSALEDSGLKYKEAERVFSDKDERDTVINQSIDQGEKVKKGTTVKVVISRGEAIEAPDLSGVSRDDSEKIAKEKNLKIKVKGEEYSDDIEKDAVISQKPAADTEMEAESVIEVILSKGIEQVKVPDVTGKSQEEAEKALKEAKLEASVSNEYSGSVEYGTVISQSEEAGESIDKNSTVTISVSIGPAPVYRSSSSGKSSGKKKTGGGGASGQGTEF